MSHDRVKGVTRLGKARPAKLPSDVSVGLNMLSQPTSLNSIGALTTHIREVRGECARLRLIQLMLIEMPHDLTIT